MKKNANCIRIAIITNAVRPKRTLVIFFRKKITRVLFGRTALVSVSISSYSIPLAL